jgi:hypothetical protein
VADDTILAWGMLVTAFLSIAVLLTARVLFENYLTERAEKKRDEERLREISESNSGL